MRIGFRITSVLKAGSVFFLLTFLMNCGSESADSSQKNRAVLAALIPGATTALLNGTSAPSHFQQGITSSQVDSAFQAENDGSFTFNDSIVIRSADGTSLAANLFQPKNLVSGQKYPTVIFVNSWALNEYEYLVPAAKLAKKGYIVLSYSTRGFGISSGLINTAGVKDRQDLSAVIDWLQTNTQVDSSNIGISGISYGAGISLLGVSSEPRIKTAVAMSGWGDLKRSLYGNDTPRLVWGLILIGAGYFTGRMDPVIAENFGKLLSHTDIAGVTTWAAERSPASFVSQLNASGKPVYISSNFEDFLFNPNQMLDYYASLTVPKKLDMNEGIHATAEIGGILGLSNPIWDNAYAWFDYWLKGINNGIMTKPQVSFQKRFNGPRVTLPSWPSSTVSEKTYYLKPRTLFTDGKISSTQNTNNQNTGILSGADTIATTGIPLISDILASHLEVPVTASLDWLSRINGIVYESDSLASVLKIRGKIIWKGQVSSSLGKANVNVYFYDVGSNGVGKLITHGTASVYVSAFETSDLTIDLNAVAYDVPAGNRIAIALDTFDPQYAVPTALVYGLDVKHNPSNQSTLSIQAE
ncbi:CocE/NonD family hydrolase [Leptospira stimsonii]|uniref:Esterase n=1 Tax=Leptospira stimsonii TaxID=2202203 RepID=A0A396YWL0_9LEPT|nr:CocE/NonD family hydrolase [Leptospira stimsonii]RHX85786.1 esterase [Leptospira stimsonii]